jgi:hypothetical protein
MHTRDELTHVDRDYYAINCAKATLEFLPIDSGISGIGASQNTYFPFVLKALPLSCRERYRRVRVNESSPKVDITHYSDIDSARVATEGRFEASVSAANG